MKIRGNTVGTTLKPEKAVVKCQNLTPEEKAKARKNIGVDTLIVTIDEESKTASHTATEIISHVKNGGTVFLDGMTLDSYDEGVPLVRFAGVEYEDGVFFGYEISDDGSFEMYEYSLSGDDGSSLLTVTIDEDDNVSHTSEQIYDHVQAGGMAILVVGEEVYTLSGALTDGSSVTFSHMTEEGFFYQYQIFADGSTYFYEHNYVEAGNIGDRLPHVVKFVLHGGQYVLYSTTHTVNGIYRTLKNGGVCIANVQDDANQRHYSCFMGYTEVYNQTDGSVALYVYTDVQNDCGFVHVIGEADYYRDGDTGNKTLGNEIWREL